MASIVLKIFMYIFIGVIWLILILRNRYLEAENKVMKEDILKLYKDVNDAIDKKLNRTNEIKVLHYFNSTLSDIETRYRVSRKNKAILIEFLALIVGKYNLGFLDSYIDRTISVKINNMTYRQICGKLEDQMLLVQDNKNIDAKYTINLILYLLDK